MDALLKKTGVELELLIDQDVHLLTTEGLEAASRYGVQTGYAKASNSRVEGYDPSKPTNYITYLDANRTCTAGR